MRISNFHHSLPIDKLPVWAACFVVAILLTATASAQNRRGRQPSQPLPPPVMDRNSDRFTLPENNPQYVEKMVARLNMTNRESDPFGRSQDPDAKPAVVPTTTTQQRITSLPQNISLQQIVSFLKVSTIIPAENRFLINDRSFQVGEILPINYRNKAIKAQILSVSASKIDFRDTESGETASLDLELLPPGMQPGSNISQTPGLFRNDAEAPIILDGP